MIIAINDQNWPFDLQIFSDQGNCMVIEYLHVS